MVRMSIGEHRQITLREGDTVILSAMPIPGNEQLFNRTVDNLFRQGVDVLYHELGDVHVSGHGGRGTTGTCSNWSGPSTSFRSTANTAT